MKDKIEVEYALRDMKKPIGVSAFELSEIILENLKTQLPTIEEMEQKMNAALTSSFRQGVPNNERYSSTSRFSFSLLLGLGFANTFVVGFT